MSPTLSETASFFDAIASRYDRDYARPTPALREHLARVLEAIAGRERVLDLGVGTGRELPALLDAGHAVIGLDCSEKMVAECNRRARTVPIVIGDAWERLPFDDGSFDAVLALFGTLAHPPDRGALARVASEVARVLAPGGVFALEVPSLAWVTSLPPVAPEGAARAVTRVADGHAHHRDRVLGASIDVVAFSEAEWREALAAFEVRAAQSDPEELVLFATKRA